MASHGRGAGADSRTERPLRIIVKLSHVEYQALYERSQAVGVPMSTLMRAAMFEKDPTPAPISA
jgi:hypothetical protein